MTELRDKSIWSKLNALDGRQRAMQKNPNRAKKGRIASACRKQKKRNQSFGTSACSFAVTSASRGKGCCKIIITETDPFDQSNNTLSRLHVLIAHQRGTRRSAGPVEAWRCWRAGLRSPYAQTSLEPLKTWLASTPPPPTTRWMVGSFLDGGGFLSSRVFSRDVSRLDRRLSAGWL